MAENIDIFKSVSYAKGSKRIIILNSKIFLSTARAVERENSKKI